MSVPVTFAAYSRSMCVGVKERWGEGETTGAGVTEVSRLRHVHDAGRDFEAPMRPNAWVPSAPAPPDMLRIVGCIQRPYAGGPVAPKRMSQLGDARDASRCIRHGRKTRPSVPCTPAPLPLRTN